MKNPLTFAYLVGTNLLLNGVDILKETVAAVGDW
jgi:hypothetical protein